MGNEIPFWPGTRSRLSNTQGDFADFTNTSFADYDQIIQQLPVYDTDYPQLRVGDAGIKLKRWYIEGYERFQDSEDVVGCLPKGIEIRTTLHSSIRGVISELTESYDLLCGVAESYGFSPACISFNPYQTVFNPDPPLNPYERQRRLASPEMQTAEIVMLTYGPDLSFSCAEWGTDRNIDIGRKLTCYSPYILPFSFSSPFYGGEMWDGLSVRTYFRTGPRPACMVFIDEPDRMIETFPSLTQAARVPPKQAVLSSRLLTAAAISTFTPLCWPCSKVWRWMTPCLAVSPFPTPPCTSMWRGSGSKMMLSGRKRAGCW